MPGLKQPLAEVRISLQQNQLILGRERQKFTPEGQRCIDFDLGEHEPIPLPANTYEDLFFQALEDEEAGRLGEGAKTRGYLFQRNAIRFTHRQDHRRRAMDDKHKSRWRVWRRAWVYGERRLWGPGARPAYSLCVTYGARW